MKKKKNLKNNNGPIKNENGLKNILICVIVLLIKYKKQIKKHILSQKDKKSEHGWNEILVNQINIQDVFLLKRSDYPIVVTR